MCGDLTMIENRDAHIWERWSDVSRFS